MNLTKELLKKAIDEADVNFAGEKTLTLAEAVFGKEFVDKLNVMVDFVEDQHLRETDYYAWVVKHCEESKKG